jgi:hypothetical protein
MVADLVLTLPEAIAIASISIPVGAAMTMGMWKFIPSKTRGHDGPCPLNKPPIPCSDHKHLIEDILLLKQSVEISNRAIYGKLDTVSNELARLCGYIEGQEKYRHDNII